MWTKDDWIKAYAIKCRLSEIALAELYKFDPNKAREVFADSITQILNGKDILKEDINKDKPLKSLDTST